MLLTDIQIVQEIWPQLLSIVRVPRTESDYHQLLGLRTDLITFVGEDENHPLVSLIEVIEVLVEKYVLDRDATECDTLYRFCLLMLTQTADESEEDPSVPSK